MDSNDVIQFLTNLLATTIGAWFGAWAAFRLERRRRADEQEESEAQAGCEVLADAALVAAFQDDVWAQQIQPYLKQPDLWLNLPRTLPLQPRELRSSRLSFLLQTPDAHLLFLVEQESSRHRIWIDTINARSEIRGKQVHDALVGRDVSIMTDADIRTAITDRVYVPLRMLTEQLVEVGRLNRESAWEIVGQLRGALIKRYPKAKIPLFARNVTAPGSTDGNESPAVVAA